MENFFLEGGTVQKKIIKKDYSFEYGAKINEELLFFYKEYKSIFPFLKNTFVYKGFLIKDIDNSKDGKIFFDPTVTTTVSAELRENYDSHIFIKRYLLSFLEKRGSILYFNDTDFNDLETYFGFEKTNDSRTIISIKESIEKKIVVLFWLIWGIVMTKKDFEEKNFLALLPALCDFLIFSEKEKAMISLWNEGKKEKMIMDENETFFWYQYSKYSKMYSSCSSETKIWNFKIFAENSTENIILDFKNKKDDIFSFFKNEFRSDRNPFKTVVRILIFDKKIIGFFFEKIRHYYDYERSDFFVDVAFEEPFENDDEIPKILKKYNCIKK